MTLRQNDLKQKNHGRFCIEKNIRITTTPIRHPKTKQKTRNKTTTCRGPAPVVRSVAKYQAIRRTFCRVNRPWSSLGRNVNPATWKYYKQAAKWNGQPTALSPSRLAAAPLESGDRDMFDTGLTCPCGADHSHKWFFFLFFFCGISKDILVISMIAISLLEGFCYIWGYQGRHWPTLCSLISTLYNSER